MANITFHARKAKGTSANTHVALDLWKDNHVLGTWLLTNKEAICLADELLVSKELGLPIAGSTIHYSNCPATIGRPRGQCICSDMVRPFNATPDDKSTQACSTCDNVAVMTDDDTPYCAAHWPRGSHNSQQWIE